MKRVLIYRHPECERCARIARVNHALDWLDRIESSTDTPPGGALEPGHIAVIDLATGRRLVGAEAIGLIFKSLPVYWPLLPLLWIPALRRRLVRDVDPGHAEARNGEFRVAQNAS